MRPLVWPLMRAPSPRRLAVLALSGVLCAGALAGCGKGARTSSMNARSVRLGAAPTAQGVVGIATKNTTRLGGADPATDAAAVAQAVYPGLTPATRPQAVVLVNERDWPASLTASVLDEAGGLFIEASRSGPADRPRELGRAVGLELLAKGAAEIIERSRPLG